MLIKTALTYGHKEGFEEPTFRGFKKPMKDQGAKNLGLRGVN
jgi:hypothetical protein